MKPEKITAINEAIATRTKQARYGDRHARQFIQQEQVKRAAKFAASPAGLLNLFPGLKKGKP